MYRIDVLTCGKFHNVTIAPRYCFRKKTAKKLIELFLGKNDCQITVTKLNRITSDIFGWVDEDPKDSVFDYYFDLMVGEE